MKSLLESVSSTRYMFQPKWIILLFDGRWTWERMIDDMIPYLPIVMSWWVRTGSWGWVV